MGSVDRIDGSSPGIVSPPVHGDVENAASAPQRRSGDLMSLVLDELDYGIALLGADQTVLHLNFSARRDLLRLHGLKLVDGRLQAPAGPDAAVLTRALEDALLHSRRCLVGIGAIERRSYVGVVPLTRGESAAVIGAVVIFGRAAVCSPLSLHWFSKDNGLTPAESQVLETICNGARPVEVAGAHGVALSTIRSQIGTIRQKTRTESVFELVREAAFLPPLVGALRSPASVLS